MPKKPVPTMGATPSSYDPAAVYDFTVNRVVRRPDGKTRFRPADTYKARGDVLNSLAALPGGSAIRTASKAADAYQPA